MPRHRRAAPWQIGDLFAHEREAAAYEAAVDACLAEPAVARRLGKRPQATAENVRAHMLSEANVRRALEPCREHHLRFRAALEQYQAARTRVDYLHDPPAPATIALALLSLIFLGALVTAPWTGVAVAAVPPVVLGAVARTHPLWRMRVHNNVGELVLRAALFVRQRQAEHADRRWRRDLQVNGVRPLMRRVVEALLGDDHDSLLLPDSYEGLRSPRSRQYVVGNEASRRLARKVAQLRGGTIAVSGPRGAGKSTLLETCAAEADFSVVVQAPATYSPYEFLLSLYIRVCETYLKDEGHEVPEFARLSAFRRVLLHVVPAARRVTRHLLFAASAGALVVLGLAATARSMEDRYEETVRERARDVWGHLTGTLEGIWGGERAGAALAVTLTGVLIWRLRRWPGTDELLRSVRLLTGGVGGVALVLVAPVSLFLDTDIRRNARVLVTESFGALGVLLLVSLLTLSLAALKGQDVGLWPGSGFPVTDRVLKTALGLLLVVVAVLLHQTPALYALAADDDNAFRVACVLLGVLMARAGAWNAPQPEPRLVRECRNQLYRLQTVQTTSAAVTAGPPQLLSAYTSSLSTVPPNMPELVADFRELLADIAQERFARDGRVVIAIDEVDRLGSDAQALEFLGEIKAILGVPGVHYLISVAEDVGASFVRRGLPHRGVTDSSLDDIVHVQPCTLSESVELLQRRAPGLSEPYSLLAHALSGGLPRDLMRYGLRIMEIEDKTRFVELTDISRQMILEELSETMAGFRTLLGKHEWTPETSATLLSFRSLMGHLRYLCPCPSPELQKALQHVAFYDLEEQLGTDAAANVPEATRLLIDEASAYVLFSLTLLDVFGRPDFARRREAARRHGPDGDPEMLAQARQELELSPYSARPLITAVRTAWGVASRPAAGTVTTIPAARRSPCALHAQPV
ncbi:hypothetical protein SUDANB105_01799 [Streptomyces sp. enrichment culture]|uniref:hypothetical protein n=1 Tax=Streptomyces sp. enrichment culture TaxID=1795815 RepID=UPI003F542CEA